MILVVQINFTNTTITGIAMKKETLKHSENKIKNTVVKYQIIPMIKL